ncbi:molybdopterin-binding protein [Virgisporangium aliadipatigenens]|uniref:Molybdopterin-binding protein n=1 Tax=Virgisporangium aliadipatigenens TaxID=741659 RepID=A0A8J3YGL2_9ACTN|nr:molybdopterin-dependent oxidoreductase [Virgisporangium aliadipatigenens]GIJ43848.1 molybdopterin-binding protein [Virgisporangium aliadipatigenens]
MVRTPALRAGPVGRARAALSKGPVPRFTSALRSPWLVSRLGLWLALAIGVCFATGLYSHALQHPAWWFTFPTRPVSLYRVTQGVHVATGLAAIPLLAAKLWSVYPRLFALPPVRDAAHALERAGIAALVAGTLFEFVTGVLNVARVYGLMPFYFPAAHYRAAWLVVGGLLLHVAVKLPLIRAALTGPPPAPAPDGVSRRALFGFVGAAGIAVTAATLGQTLRPLAGLSVLAPRDPRIGPQGLPVNRTAAAAGVRTTAEEYRLEVAGPARTLRLSLADLAALPQHTATLPIACVEGWSANGVWSGVRVTDLVRAVGGTRDSGVTVESLQRAGRYRVSTLDSAQAADPLALLALRLGGEPLHPDHGYPLRLIAPNRPGVLQTKWVGRIEVSA